MCSARGGGEFGGVAWRWRQDLLLDLYDDDTGHSARAACTPLCLQALLADVPAEAVADTIYKREHAAAADAGAGTESGAGAGWGSLPASVPVWGSLHPVLTASPEDDGTVASASLRACVRVEQALFDVLAATLHPATPPFLVLLQSTGDETERGGAGTRLDAAGSSMSGGSRSRGWKRKAAEAVADALYMEDEDAEGGGMWGAGENVRLLVRDVKW